MSNFNLDYIFRYGTTEPLSASDEREAILAAQAGDADAFMRVLDACGPMIRKAFAGMRKLVDEDEAQAEILATFTEAIMTDGVEEYGYTESRLAPKLRPMLLRASVVARLNTLGVSVARVTYERYLSVMNAAGGDANAAREAAPASDLSRDTFDAIHAVVRMGSIDVQEPDSAPIADRAIPLYDDGSRTTETARLEAQEAREALAGDAEASRVISLAYGFGDDEAGLSYGADPMSDGGVADIMGMSRPTVQRRHKAALSTMRKALIASHM